MYKPICIIDTCPNYQSYCRIAGHTIPEVKTKKTIAKVSAKKLAKDKEDREDGSDLDLKGWFEKMRNIIKANPICENCGGPISEQHYLHSSAHLLPKRKDYGFPSVRANINNHLVLCVTAGCHQLWDRAWSDAEMMEVFPLALERFRLFADSIIEEERFRVPDIFYEIIPKKK